MKIPELKTPNQIIRDWKGAAGFSAPFRTSGDPSGGGNNDGFIYDSRGFAIISCLGNEAAADVVTAALNLAYTYHT